MKKISGKQGFMQIVILAIVVIAALAYFNIDLRTIFARPEIQKVWHVLVVTFNTYLLPMFKYLFTNISAIFNK